MKRNFLLWHFVCCVLAFAFLSCSDEQVINEENGFATLNFQVSPFEKTPMNASTRAIAASKAFSRLSLVLFDTDDKAIITETQVSAGESDENFGKVAITVPYGSYKLVIIGHKGDDHATVTSPTNITFPNDELTDTFYAYQTLTVDKDSETNLSIELTRAVARFQLDTEDNFPADIQSITFTIEGGGVAFNAVTGCAAATKTQTKNYTVTSSAGKSPTVNVYSFISSTNEEKLTITVSSKSSDGKTLAERTFTNVPMQRNYTTLYKGYFFSSSNEWTVSVSSTDYAGTNTKDF